MCYIIDIKRATANSIPIGYKVVDQDGIAMPPVTGQSIRVALAMYSYLQNVNTNVSNAKRNMPKVSNSIREI